MNKKWIYLLIVSFVALLSACNGESPIARFEDEKDEFDKCSYSSTCCNNCYRDYGYYECKYCTDPCYDAYGNNICYESSSSGSYDYWEDCVENYNVTCCNTCYDSFGIYECEYCTDSCYDAYGNYLCNALRTSKAMYFTLTYYYQKSSGWDGLDGSGDPEVSFSVSFITESGAIISTRNTGILLDKTNTEIWSGTSSVTLTAPALTDTVKVCPEVLDEDISYHDDYSSGFCFKIAHIGTLNNYEVVEQKDSNYDYILEWEWYLY